MKRKSDVASGQEVWLVDPEMRGRPLCQRKHAPGHACSRVHEIPEGSFWSGPVGGFKGDFLEDLKIKRGAFRRLHGRWRRQLHRMTSKICAPAFRAYLDAKIKEHRESEPKFSFSWPEES